jgi:uncharacterized protein (DUF697 family)
MTKAMEGGAMALPFDVRELVNTGSRFAQDREHPVRLIVFVEPDAAEALLDEVQEALMPRTGSARVEIAVAGDAARVDIGGADAVIVLAGSGTTDGHDAVDIARAAKVPVAAVAIGQAEDRASDVIALRLGLPIIDMFRGPVADALVAGPVASWLVGRVPSKSLALAANFPVLRRAVAEGAVRATALQNALVGVVMIIPGADMPIMVLNQAKMLLQIAAAYGERMGPERMRELAFVVGGGFALRTVAREALGVIPGFGWALKGGIAYGGTIAMGKAAIAWFEEGADLSTVVRRVRDQVAELTERGPSATVEPALAPAGEPQVPTAGEGDGA